MFCFVVIFPLLFVADMKKYQVARDLKKHIEQIRKSYQADLTSSDNLTRQRGEPFQFISKCGKQNSRKRYKKKNKITATALYLIDKLALRVGNEKGEDEADTVGCCSLRCEHIKLGTISLCCWHFFFFNSETAIVLKEDPAWVEFDFLGKDSMRYQNRVQVEENVYKNLKKFMRGKKEKDDLFDMLTVNRQKNDNCVRKFFL